MKSNSVRGALCVTSATLVVAIAGVASPVYAASSTAAGTTEKSAADTGTSKTRRAGELLDDTVITSKVKAAFVQDDTVSALRINVTSNSGIVQLSGFANSPKEAERAAKVAREVPGVKDVKNDIVVKQQQKSY